MMLDWFWPAPPPVVIDDRNWLRKGLEWLPSFMYQWVRANMIPATIIIFVIILLLYLSMRAMGLCCRATWSAACEVPSILKDFAKKTVVSIMVYILWLYLPDILPKARVDEFVKSFIQLYNTTREL